MRERGVGRGTHGTDKARKRMGGYGICMSIRLQDVRNGMQPAVAWAEIRRMHPRDTVVIEKVQ